jgi:hypothetical protein
MRLKKNSSAFHGTLLRVCERTLLAVLLLLCTAGLGLAQNTNSGEIRGSVTDPSGAVIPGVAVTIVNIDTGVTTKLSTNDVGIYDAVSILPGKYRITFVKQGFNDLVRDGISLSVGLLALNAQLTIGTAQQAIQVTGEAPLLKTESAEQSASFGAETMAMLPNVGQNWGNFMKILPGAVLSPQNGGIGMAVNGSMPFYASFLADGGSTALPHSANVDISNFETVSEIQVQTSTFSAQYGIGGAVFNQISKSGTNQFHGSGYEYLQNNYFNARNTFSPSVGRLRYHNYGGSVGGPVLKNKMFFYFNYDNTWQPSQSFPIRTYPTAAAKSGDFSDPAYGRLIYDPATLSGGVRQPFDNNRIPTARIDPVANNIQALYLTPTKSGLSDNWQKQLGSKTTWPKFFGRLDYNITSANRLSFSITQRNQLNGQGNNDPICPVNCAPSNISSINSQLSDVWTITPTTVNEFRFGYTRQGNWFVPDSLGQGYPTKLGMPYMKADILPTIGITGPFNPPNIQPGTNAIYAENSWQPGDVVTMIKGKHILKFGGELMMFQDNSTAWGNINGGNLSFTGDFTRSSPTSTNTGLGYADFLLGQVQRWNAAISPLVGARQKSPQLFFQDDLKVRPNLTLNLGVRYQIQNGWSERYNRLGLFDPTITNPANNTLGAMWFAPGNGRNSIQKSVKNLVLPRIGASWSLTKDWVVRGGFGISTYPWSLDIYGQGMGAGANSTGDMAVTDKLNPLFVLSNPNPSLTYVSASHAPESLNGQTVTYRPYNTPVARIYQWSFSIQRELGRGMLAEAAYTGSHGINLSWQKDFNQVPASKLGTTSDPKLARPYPLFQGINDDLYDAYSNYNSMQLSIKKRYSAGVSWEANYTWSKMLANMDSSGWSGRGGTGNWQDAYSPKSNYSLSNLDAPHMLKWAATYELPLGKGKQFLNQGGVLDYIVNGWQMSGMFNAVSGQPFTPTISGGNDSNSLAGTWRPNVISKWKIDNWTPLKYFDPAAFAKPLVNTFGNAGRNIIRGPGAVTFDFSAHKNIRIPVMGEGGQLQLRFDALNALNHVAYGTPNTAIDGGTPAKITSLNPNVGARTLQLGVRLGF